MKKKEHILMPEGIQLTIEGKAVCGRCRFKIGQHCHVAIVQDEGVQRRIVSLLPNQRLYELEQLITRCPTTTGIQAQGAVTVYRGQNHLLMTAFSLLEEPTRSVSRRGMG